MEKGQFTPLCEALCWIINKLESHRVATNNLQENSIHQNESITDVSSIQKALLEYFPNINPPEPNLIYAALTDLIRQRKVFHASNGYGIVQPNTYLPTAVKQNSYSPSSRLITESKLVNMFK